MISLTWLVGIDEAGYGPLLGPLVVSATLWRLPEDRAACDLWDALSDCVCRKAAPGEWRFEVGDSKEVFDRKKGLFTLERAVLAFVRSCGLQAEDGVGLLSSISLPAASVRTGMPWYRDLGFSLPLGGARSFSVGGTQRLAAAMERTGVRCAHIASCVVPEDVFNDRARVTRNKAAVLVEQVLRLVARALEADASAPLRIVVDRLGGRHNYRAMLQSAFDCRSLTVLDETPTLSRYHVQTDRQWQIEFVVQADRDHLPVALASMVSKYVRELLMSRFNLYWRRHAPKLRPTAGYYGDARRFIEAVRPLAAEVGLPVDSFVRVC